MSPILICKIAKVFVGHYYLGLVLSAAAYLQVLAMCSNAREADSADVDKLAKTIVDVPIIIGMAGAPKTVMKPTEAIAPSRTSTTGI